MPSLGSRKHLPLKDAAVTTVTGGTEGENGKTHGRIHPIKPYCPNKGPAGSKYKAIMKQGASDILLESSWREIYPRGCRASSISLVKMGGSRVFEAGTNGGICQNCSMKTRWWSNQTQARGNSEEKPILFLETEAAGFERA